MNKIELIEKMLKEVFQEINPAKIPVFFTKNFVLETNGEVMNYEEFTKHVEQLVVTHNKVSFHFPLDDTFISADGSKVVTRYRIETDWKSGRHDELIVLAVYELEHSKISKWWETVYLQKSNELRP